MRRPPSLTRRVWRVAAGAGAAIETAAVASNVVVRMLQPVGGERGGQRRPPDGEEVELLREIEACEVRLRLLPPTDVTDRDESFRRELVERRDAAAARLARAGATIS